MNNVDSEIKALLMQACEILSYINNHFKETVHIDYIREIRRNCETIGDLTDKIKKLEEVKA